MPYCCNNALNMLRKCPNFMMHILVVIIIIIIIIILLWILNRFLPSICNCFFLQYDFRLYAVWKVMYNRFQMSTFHVCIARLGIVFPARALLTESCRYLCQYHSNVPPPPPPPLFKGAGRTFQKLSHLGGRVPKICQRRGITLKREVWYGGGGGLPHFYYFTVQLYLLCVGEKSKVSFFRFWFFSLWS